MRLFLSIVALICTSVLVAQQTETNTASHDSVYKADARIQVHDLKNYISVFTDSSNKITIQEIASGKLDQRFQPISGMDEFVAQPYITYWLKLTITTSSDIQDWWLILNSSAKIGETIQHGYVDSWFINRINQATEHQRTGVLVPRSQKSVRENPGLNRILFSVKAGETKDVYLRVYNEFGQGISSTLQLRNPSAGFHSEKNLGLIFGSGAAFFFSIMSFFFFFFVRDKSYLFFCTLCPHAFTALSYSASRYSIYRPVYP